MSRWQALTWLIAAWLAMGCAVKTEPARLSPVLTATFPLAEADAPVTLTETPLPEPWQAAIPTVLLQITPSPAPPTPSPTALPEGNLVLQHAIRYLPWELVHDLTWSQEGRWLAIAAGEKVYIYEGIDFKLQQELEIGVWISEVAFSPLPVEGEILLVLTARDGSLQFWSVSSDDRRMKLHAHHKGANSLAFSPDGHWLVTSGNDAIIRLWDWKALLEGETTKPQSEMIGGAFAVPRVRFSPDGSLLAAVDLQSVRLRDPQSARLARTLRAEASIFSIAFSPDGAFLAVAESASRVRLWDIAQGKAELFFQTGQADPRTFLWDVAFNPQGDRLAAVSSQGEISIWTFPEGASLAAFLAHGRAGSALAFSPDGKQLATGGLDGVVYIWQAP